MYEFVTPGDRPVELPRDGVLITESMVNHFGVSVGDQIDLKSFIPGREDTVVTVRGVVKQTLGINMYADIAFMQGELTDRGLINGVFINSDRPVKEVLDDYPGVAAIQSLKDLRESFMAFMDYTIYSVLVMTFFAAILGFAIVYNSSIMTIGERSLEFSSMRVMGFTKVEIFQLITRETLIIAFFGLLLGIPLGEGMLYGIGATFNNDLYTMNMTATPLAHLKTAGLTGIFIALSVLATYEKIHRLNFIDALKNRMT
jgi:putative ABC transport system permease protein